MLLRASLTMLCNHSVTSKRFLAQLTSLSSGLAKLVRKREQSSSCAFKLTTTGWPTAGSQYEAATPSVSNAHTYWSTGICGILAWGVNVFSFEAFDEPWKPVSVGKDGSVADETHWGVFNADRSSKYSTTC